MAPTKVDLNKSLATFYQINHEKGKYFTFSQFKKQIPKPTIYRIMKSIETGDRCAKDFPQETIQKMFENLPNKIYKAAESGLESLN